MFDLFSFKPITKLVLSRSNHNRYRRAAMISLAHIGSSDNGFRVLNQCASEFVPYCLNLIKTTEKLSLRGTVFVVTGLLSQSAHGRQILADHGWSSPESPAAVSMSTDTTSVFSHIRDSSNKKDNESEITGKKEVEEQDSTEMRRRHLRGESVASIYLVAGTAATSAAEDLQDQKEDIPEILKPKLSEIRTADLDEVRRQIMDHIIQLSNGIINATARKRLLELKTTSSRTQKGTSSPFMDPSFFSLVLRQTLNASSLTLASRQFVLFELFGELLEQNGMSLLAEEMNASSRPTSPSSTSRPCSPRGMRKSPSREFRLDIRE